MKRALVLAAIGLLTGASIAEAQRPEHPERPGRDQVRFDRRPAPATLVGVRASYDFDRDAFGLGAQAQFPVGVILRIVPSADVHFGDDTTWQLNGDVMLSLLFLRAGGGLAIAEGAETGLNLFAGIQSLGLRGARVRTFAEARWTFLGHVTPFRLAAGLNIPVR